MQWQSEGQPGLRSEARTARNIKNPRDSARGYDCANRCPRPAISSTRPRDSPSTLLTGSTLEQLAARAGWSPFHLHRAFRAMVRETPKQYALRLQLQQAATRLVSSDDSVLDIALAAGFNSHEVFTRAFRRHFGLTPAAYRARALAGASAEMRTRHVALVHTSGPCFGLYHVPTSSRRRSSMPTLSIERREIAAQHILFVRLRVARHEIANAIGEGLGKAFPYSQRLGLAIAGRPFTRYLSTGPGLYNIEVGMPVATAPRAKAKSRQARFPRPCRRGDARRTVRPAQRDLRSARTLDRSQRLPHRRCSVGVLHHRPDRLPDPADWRTEVYWPLEK